MGWDWSDTFKGLTATGLAALSTWAYKRLKPTFRLIRRFWNVANQSDILLKTVSILEAEQLALFHIDFNPILIKNIKGEVTYCNPAFLDLTGFDNVEDAYGFGFTEAIHLDDKDRADRLRQQQSAYPTHGTIKFINVQSKEPVLVVFKTKPIFYKGDFVEVLIRLYIITE